MAFAYVSREPQFRTRIATVKDVLTLDAFNAMEEADIDACSANSCADDAFRTAFIKNVVREIRSGGKPIEINFFMDAFGYTPRMSETKEIYNRYTTDLDYNVIPAASVTGAAAGDAATFQLIREQHSGSGAYSYPQIGYVLVDKENYINYQITDVVTTTDYAHLIEVTPWDENVTVSLKAGKKYFVMPSRPVPGNSCPQNTNDIQTIGYVQKLNPFRFRRDWKITEDLQRGYKDIFRFRIKFDYKGNPIDSWETYESVRSQEGMQLSMNVVSLFASPITNPLLLSGADVVTDSIHTGYYGLLPILQTAAQMIDFDPAIGFDLKSDLEPFVLFQDSLKRCNRFMVKCGKGFKAGLIDRTNTMVRQDGLGLYNFDIYKRLADANGGTIEKFGIDSYKLTGLNFFLDFTEWSSFTDTRLIGSDKLSNLGIFIATDGTYDAKTNAPVQPIEFFQYGMTETGDYRSSTRRNFNIDGCETIEGSHVQSIMMAVHAPEMHMLANPVPTC